MTICFFSGDITRCGGTEKVSGMIANRLKRQGRHRIIFLSLMEKEPEPFFSLEEGIERYRLGDKWINPGPGYLKLLPKLRHFFKKQSVDVVIDIDIVLDSLSIPASRGIKTKVISWEHFSYAYEQAVLYRRLIRRFSVRHADYIITLTDADKELYAHNLKRTERIMTIGNPIEEWTPDPAITKEKWIITVGALVEVKGIDYLAEIAGNVLQKYPDWKWILLGEGDMRPVLEEKIRTEGLQDRLILKGNVRNVSEYLQQAQVYVMTSRSEGLPMVLLEAKAHGLPCVSFAIPGPLEIIEDQINGFLVQPFSCGEMEEKIACLLENEDLRKRFAEGSSQGVERYQPDRILEQWNQVIDLVCE